MFTEYIFENKGYELAVRDLKSTLFDIVASENSKLSVIEAKTHLEINLERKKELEKLCKQQNACLKKVLEISGELSDSLMQLDSYSKELNKLENENIAEIIANLGDRKIEEAYQTDIAVANQERDDLARDMIEKAGELDSEEYPREEIIGNIKTMKQGFQEETPLEEQEMTFEKTEEYPEENAPEYASEVVEQDKTQEEIGSEVAPEEIDRVSNISEVVPDVVGAFVPADANPTMEEESVSMDGEDVGEVATEEMVAPAVVIEPFLTEKGLEEEKEFQEENGHEIDIEETEEVGDVPVVKKTIDEIETASEVSEEAKKDSEASFDEVKIISEKKPKIELPVIEGIKPVEAIGSIQNVTPIVQVPVVEEAAEIVDRQDELASENQELAKEVGMGIVQKLKFMKVNANVTRAILTAKKQITNLRESKDTMEALYNARRKVLDISVAKNTIKEINSAIDEAKIEEQQLIDNGLLEPTAVDRQKQIEEMLEKANSLYKEGKAEEAKEMYDRISILNKEMQTRNRGTK